MLDRFASNELTAGLQRNHAPALFAVNGRGQHALEPFGAVERTVELREADADALPRFVFDMNETRFPAIGKLALHKQSHTSSGVSGVLGPSECGSKLSRHDPIGGCAKLQVKPESVTYIRFTVFLRSLAGFPAAQVFKLILRSKRTFKASGL